MAEQTKDDDHGRADGAMVTSKSRHERVGEDQSGQRVDNFLIRHCPGVPRSHIYQLIRKGAVLVDGRRIKQTRKLVLGEQVRIPAMRVTPDSDVRVPARLANVAGAAVLVEHEDFLVVNKPAGVAVHGGSGLAFGLIDALRQSRNESRLELAHRLDKATSGCLLIGRTMNATRRLQELFRSRTIEKRYLALVDGQWPEQVSRVDAPLLKNAEHAGERRVIVSNEGQASLTFFKVVRCFAEATLLDVTLETGRTHQIRVHSKHVGCAVVGDKRYGDNRRNAHFKKLGLSRLYLHSQSLAFDWGDARVVVAAPTGSQWDRTLDNLHS